MRRAGVEGVLFRQVSDRLLAGAPTADLRFAVNQRIPDHQLRVPLDQMIYVGDGLTDMPCFSVLYRADGIALGVGGEGAKEKWGRAAQAAGKKAGRISNLAPADFREDAELLNSLLLAVESIGTRIAIRQKAYRD